LSHCSPDAHGLLWRTAGESHGLALIALLEGLPAGWKPDIEAIRAGLARRWEGPGRGLRADFEQDRLTVLAGFRNGVTLGSPVALQIENSDQRIDSLPQLKAPRPGHADLPFVLRTKTRDVRAALERASARETAARTALGELARQLLAEFGVQISSEVLEVGGVDASDEAEVSRVLDAARESGDSLGGRFRVCATGMPPGVGGFAQAADRLDGRLMGLLASIPAVKAVSIGRGAEAGSLLGSAFHDGIEPQEGGWAGLGRSSNHAGGIEGGLTNGQPIELEGTLKPIPTMRRGAPSVDLATGEPARATYERSDLCVVHPAAVVAEALLALELASALRGRLGGVTLKEMRQRFEALGAGDDPADWPAELGSSD